MDLFIDSNILNEALGNVKDTSSMNSNSTKFIDFLNRLEGWKTKCKISTGLLIRKYTYLP